uniref:YqaJ viral recombinase domain-containing protein n=2 Tax=Echeneis naucrates TaxID=173247 RepID=A0A665UJ07_ECHNA
MQKHKSQTSAGAEATLMGPKEKIILPQVRYHPTIQTQTSGDGAWLKTATTRTSKIQKTAPAAVQPSKTGRQQGANTAQIESFPAVRLVGGHNQKQRMQTPTKKQNQKPVQTTVTGPDPPQKLNDLSNNAPPTPEELPLGLRVSYDRYLVHQVEVLTRGQRTNENWFSWRKNRITASAAHLIAHCRFVNGKSKTPPASYLAAVTGDGRRVQTKAMSWGIHMEDKVVCIYEKLKSQVLGHTVSVQDCGLFIDAQRSWLAASPDGIVKDSSTNQWLLCLEVKCPYKHRHRRVEDACREDRNFCLEIQDEDRRKPGEAPVYRLKPSHSYFTQIQCQLAVTGLKQADLVVYTTQDTTIVPVTFDPEFWEETVSKLELFYRDVVLPHLRKKTQWEQTATGSPEL